MKDSLVLVAIDNYDVFLEVEKARKDIWNKLFPKIIPKIKTAYLWGPDTRDIMAIPEDIKEHVEKQITLMISQTEAYMPFIKVAFPYSKNLADACYNLIVGSAVSVFVNQYAMRLKYPSAEDFAEFGKITVRYRDQIDKFFK